MKPFLKSFTNFVNTHWSDAKVYMMHEYGENPGKMLVHTGTLGWILSSLAQVGAVVFNDKLSAEQKSFLIPQEIADAAVNILSFYVLTNSVKTLGSKLVSTGKLRTQNISNFLKKNNLLKRVGKMDFDLADTNTYGKDAAGLSFDQISDHYKAFKNGIDVLTSTAGSIVSCNILTPVFRNEYASKRQKQTIAAMQRYQNANIQHPKGISIEDYQKLASMKFSSPTSGSMRV